MDRLLVAYARTSSSSQVGNDSIPAQLESIRNFAAKNGYTILGVHVDSGQTGANLKRPAIHAAIAQACAHRALLATANLSRLGRSTRDLIDIVDRLRQHGARFHSLAEGFLSEGSLGSLLLAVLGAVAQFELSAMRERQAVTIHHLRRSQRRLSLIAPYGWNVAADGTTLEQNENEQAVIGRIRTERAAGRSMQAIADALNVDCIRSKLGGGWSVKSIASVLRRQAQLAA